jgi:hypothetical protein
MFGGNNFNIQCNNFRKEMVLEDGHIWQKHGVRTKMEINVYKNVIFNTLLSAPNQYWIVQNFNQICIL